jgi:hypothetical protein
VVTPRRPAEDEDDLD